MAVSEARCTFLTARSAAILVDYVMECDCGHSWTHDHVAIIQRRPDGEWGIMVEDKCQSCGTHIQARIEVQQVEMEL